MARARATTNYSWMPSSSPRPHHPLYSMTMRALLLVHWRGGGEEIEVIVNHNFPDWNYVVHSNLCGTLLNNNIGYWSVRWLLPCPAQRRTDQQLATIREMVYVLTVIEQKKAMRKNTTGRRQKTRQGNLYRTKPPPRRGTQERVLRDVMWWGRVFWIEGSNWSQERSSRDEMNGRE